MRKALVIPLLLPIIGFVAVKGYYSYKVKEVVDTLVLQAAPFARIEYQSIVADFNGQAGLEAVTVHPVGSDISLTLDRVLVTAPSWTHFLNDLNAPAAASLPDAMSLRLEGVVSELDQLAGMSIAQEASSVLGCERADMGGAKFWNALGYDSLRSDIELGYRLNPANGYLNLQLSVDTDSLFSVSVHASLDSGVRQLHYDSFQSDMRFSEAGVTLTDHSYNQRRNGYCARLNGENVAAFVNRHVELLSSSYWDQGLRFNQPLIEAYRTYLMTKGVVALGIVAKEPLPLSQLRSVTSTDPFEFRLAVNGRGVAPVELGWAPSTETLITEGLLKVADSGSVASPVTVPADTVVAPEVVPGAGTVSPEGYQLTTVRRSVKPVFEEVSIDELPAHIGGTLQVDTLNGHRIDGVLDSIIRNQIRIKQEFDGGQALLPIRFDLIRAVRVLQ